MSRLRTTIDELEVGDPAEWMSNEHAGDLLKHEFLEPTGMTAEDLALRLRVAAGRLADVIEGKQRLDADLDLRLCRYFGLSYGFFLRFQTDHDLLEAKRAKHDDIRAIIPRAA